MVSPSAQIVSQSQVVLVASHTLNDLASLDLVGVDALAIQIYLAPKEEELLTHFEVDAAIDYGIPPIVLKYHIESLAVPETQIGTLPVLSIIAQNPLHLLKSQLQIGHLLGSAGNLAQGILLGARDVLVQNLK